MKTLILIVLLGHAVQAFGADEVRCEKSGSQNKVYMKSELDHVGYCGAFAFRALLQQYRCKTDEKNCELPSVLDLLGKILKDGQPMDVADPSKQFEALEKNGFKLADEKCLKYASFWGDGDSADAPLSFNGNFTSKVIEKMKPQLPNEVYCDLKKKASGLDKFDKDTGEIFVNLAKKLNREIVRSTTRATCQPRAFAPANLDILPYNGHIETLRKLLDSGQSVMAGLYIKEPDKSAKGYHAVVVTNYRQKCCLGICVRQYQLLDSLGFYWAPNASDGWVDESEFYPAMASESALITLNPRKK